MTSEEFVLFNAKIYKAQQDCDYSKGELNY